MLVLNSTTAIKQLKKRVCAVDPQEVTLRDPMGQRLGSGRHKEVWESNSETERDLAWLSSVCLLQMDVNIENVGYFVPALANFQTSLRRQNFLSIS